MTGVNFIRGKCVTTSYFDNLLSPVKSALIETVKSLYPGEKVHVDYIHPTASIQGVNDLKFDIFIPSKSLAIDLLVISSKFR